MVRLAHAFDGQTDDIYRGEGKVSAADGSLRPETVLEHSGAASHRSDFVVVSFGIVGPPEFVPVECGVQIQEVREESPG